MLFKEFRMPHNLDSIFKPKSIAVIGTSTQKNTIGRVLLHSLIEHEFNGKVFPVNPKAQVIHSMKCYPSVSAIPDEVDLALIVVPKEFVPAVVEECGKKGIKGLVIISAGFSETGPKGAALESEVVALIKKYGMRMIGPNCMGVINTDPDVNMHGTFSRAQPVRGNVGFMSQSGALGAVIIEHARRIGLGLSMFASVGNKADVSANDLLQYWEDDKLTDVILLYMENFGNPRKFTKIAKRISRKKPIIAVKSGRTAAGAKAIKSHTGALAEMDIAADALFEQCGVLRVGTVEELFELGLAFATQPLPKGNRVAILSNGGGPGILAADAAVNTGLQLAPLSEKTKSALRAALPADASVTNPVDMVAGAAAKEYRICMEALLADENVDAVLTIFTPPLMISTLDVAMAVSDVSSGSNKPVLGCFMGIEQTLGELEKASGSEFVPFFDFPESAIRTIKAMTKYAAWRGKPEGTVSTFQIDKQRISGTIAGACAAGRTQLTDNEVRDVLTACGIPVIASRVVASVDEAVDAAADMGYPVGLKVNTPKILHKTDVGGVIVDVRNETELVKAFRKIRTAVKTADNADQPFTATIQQFLTCGKETIMGVMLDPVFGPLIMFGLGGVYVEILKDVSFKVCPITDSDADEMVRSLRSFPLLKGIRGEAPVNLDVIRECLQRLSQLVADFPQIEQLDINPLIVCPAGQPSKAVDARITVTPGACRP
jgi:acetyl coenzyme A synthetase (ADP forming)-like protein